MTRGGFLLGHLVSLRVPEPVMRKLHQLKAKMILQREAKVSDAEVVGEALAFTLENQGLTAGKKKTLRDFAGIVKSGPPSNAAEDLHQVLYGD
ncbi:hypothetical protein HY572_04390 [Candidatus Micrarchaeota archaeon]|nr:hypothetical protein [Candidatus Micrarchaeota archaeon]